MNYTAAASAEVLLVFHIFLLADDNCVFKQECQKMQSIIQKFENLSGKAVNFQKSGIFFSNNVLDSLRRFISNCLGVSAPLNTGKYMGLSSLIGRNKKAIFEYLRERLCQTSGLAI